MSKFDPQTPDEIAARLVQVKAMLKAREGLPLGNWGANVKAIRAEIARLEAL